MLDWRVIRINQEVRKYDRDLFAYRGGNGAILILRKANRLEASDYNQTLPNLASLNPQLVLACTDNWRADGVPCDRGLEPIIEKLRAMDLWSKDGVLDQLRKNREAEEDQRKRTFRNNVGAMAADMRSQFAKATNDFVTT